MQVTLDSLFARPGSAPIRGGKKGEFRDWTNSTHNSTVLCCTTRPRQIVGGNCSTCERKAVVEASMCGSCFAPIVQRSYVKPITFRLSSENCSLLHKPAGSKAIWRLLRIIVYGVVCTSPEP